MINLTYVSANGKTYNLLAEKMRLTSGVLHAYEWVPETLKTVYGDRVYGFRKDSATYDITLTFRGGMQSRLSLLDELTDAFEFDISKIKPGRICYGDYYIEGFVIKSKTGPSERMPRWSQIEAMLYCPYPFWRKEQKKSFFPESRNIETYEFLDYHYGYNYDYSRPQKGIEDWYVNHYTSSNFEITVYGSCVNPRITINDNVYQVYDTLEANEYLMINSKDRTIKKYLSNGTVKNLFDSRKKTGKSIFEKIPSGSLRISWNSEFGFDILLFLERSEPPWTLS